MSEPTATKATTISERAAPVGYTSWPDYWKAQGMPWRTEPEIDEERQRYLAKRRAIQPDIERGIYPFKDIKLDRADVEWLLVTHESGGMRGPVEWSDETQRAREGVDLRGADASGVNLSLLPLARTRAGYIFADAPGAAREQSHKAATHLEAANLNGACLQGVRFARSRLEYATLREAHLEAADLFATHLEGADCNSAHLETADLRRAFFDTASALYHTVLGASAADGARLAGVRWGGADLAQVKWQQLGPIGDERHAGRRKAEDGTAKPRSVRIEEYEDAVQANRQVAIALRAQGLNEHADRFAYRAQICQRQVLRRQGIKKSPSYLGSLLLWVLAGYGYRLMRMYAAYILVLLTFAAAYYGFGLPNDHPANPVQAAMDSFLVSLTAIHGRVFFEQFGFGIQAWLAASESAVGIVLEGIFIAMLIQRWFQR